MGFLQNYVEEHRLESLSESIKDRLNQIEIEMKEKVEQNTGSSFDVCLEQYGPKIADLTARVSEQIGGLALKTLSDYIGLLRFVWNIGIEVYQLVQDLAGCVYTDTMTPEQKHDAQISFGVDLIYFIWLTADPFKNKFNWIPFKKTLEQRLIRFVARLALDSALDFFKANLNQNKIALMSDGYIRGL
jgi:hypothetical protein